MFTGIIETLGTILAIETEKNNIHFKVKAPILSEAYVDQSIAHDGVCLTITKIDTDGYWVTAIQETLEKTNLASWKVGNLVNIERAMQAQMRLDGHFVQGHVDTVTTCHEVKESDGSWYFIFKIPEGCKQLIVPKGSIAINGTSLTVILDDPKSDQFSVAIIPYTFEHTNFKNLKAGDQVNIEFDILGKYILRHIEHYKNIL